MVTEEEMFSLLLPSQRCYICKHWENITETLLTSTKSFLKNHSEMQGNIYISIHTFCDVFWKLYIHIKYWIWKISPCLDFLYTLIDALTEHKHSWVSIWLHKNVYIQNFEKFWPSLILKDLSFSLGIKVGTYVNK